jgi:hypothetical protein
MFTATLDDLSALKLTEIAKHLGVLPGGSPAKAVLVAAITNHCAPGGAILMSPLTQMTTPRRRVDYLTLLVAIGTLACAGAAVVSAVLTYSIASANAASAKSAAESATTASNLYQAELEKMRADAEEATAEREREAKSGWLEMAVYSIIGEGMKDKWNGLSIDDIKSRYTERIKDAVFRKRFGVTEKDIAEDVLQNVLFSLQKVGLVGQTVEERYIIEKYAVNPRWGSMGNYLKIADAIRSILAEKPGDSYAIASLYQAVGKNLPVKYEEYHVVLSEMERLRMVRVEDGKVISPLHPPMKNEKKKKGKD